VGSNGEHKATPGSSPRGGRFRQSRQLVARNAHDVLRRDSPLKQVIDDLQLGRGFADLPRTAHHDDRGEPLRKLPVNRVDECPTRLRKRATRLPLPPRILTPHVANEIFRQLRRSRRRQPELCLRMPSEMIDNLSPPGQQRCGSPSRGCSGEAGSSLNRRRYLGVGRRRIVEKARCQLLHGPAGDSGCHVGPAYTGYRPAANGEE
jgi:hypothetical protein